MIITPLIIGDFECKIKFEFCFNRINPESKLLDNNTSFKYN